MVTTVMALAAGPALADPPSGTTPAASDVVGVGSNTTEYLLDQLSLNYDNSHGSPSIYSWDATNPTTGAIGDHIVTKAGCRTIPRPDGSSAGITTLASNVRDPAATANYCVDYARSSRGRKSTDPGNGPGGIRFIRLATDTVTYASTPASNAPTNLTTADLTDIYDCTATHWNQVGGTSTATIHPYLAQAGSGTVSFFLTAIGVTTPGSCVVEPSTLEENEGVDPIFTGPNKNNIIIPYSAGKWLGQAYHSAHCFNAACAPNSMHLICNAGSGGTNAFGCDVNGLVKLNDINGTSPTTGTGASATVNPHFTADFIRPLYDVVRYSTATADHIPPYLEPFFAAASAATPGYFCQTAQQSVLKDYGFLPTPFCGNGS